MKKIIGRAAQFLLTVVIILVLSILNGCTEHNKMAELRSGDVIQVEWFINDLNSIDKDIIDNILSHYDRNNYTIKLRFWNKRVDLIPIEGGGIYISGTSSDIRCSDFYIFKKTTASAFRIPE